MSEDAGLSGRPDREARAGCAAEGDGLTGN